MTIIKFYAGLDPNFAVDQMSGVKESFDCEAFARKTRTMMIDYGIDEKIAEQYYNEDLAPKPWLVVELLGDLIKAVEPVLSDNDTHTIVQVAPDGQMNEILRTNKFLVQRIRGVPMLSVIVPENEIWLIALPSKTLVGKIVLI
jgi:hypothetical protein